MMEPEASPVGMCAASAALALAGLALVASLPHETFYYEMSSSMRRVNDGCRMCYDDECLELSPARCEYYMEIDEIMDKPEPGGEGSLLDGLLSELTEQATMSWLAQECTPLISKYTSCNKENLCIGCEECRCSADGRWICSQLQRCQNEPRVGLDHRTLVVVMEKLLEYEKKARRKRFVGNVTDKSESSPISLMDIAELIYGGTSANDTDSKTARADVATELTTSAIVSENTEEFTTTNAPVESEYLGFEEVLKNIANDQIYKRRKSQLYENSEDYMDFEDMKTADDCNSSENFMKMLNAIEEGNNETESTSEGKFIIDLFPREIKKEQDDYNATEYQNTMFDKEENNTIDTSPEKMEPDAINIMKRDVSYVTNINNTTQDTTVVSTTFETTTEKRHNTTTHRPDLKQHVLMPLVNIINDKQNEIKKLLQIRENLITVIEILYNTTGANISKGIELTNGNNSLISIYELDLYPEIHENLRTINPNIMNKLLYKLKRDIYEVFRDIAIIQKVSTVKSLPDDLKLLIRSLKYYVKKQGGIRDFKKNEIQLQNQSENRKFSIRKGPKTPKSLIRQFVDILEVIDKGTPQSDEFLSSSQSTKKIITRVIKQNNVEEYSILGLRTYDSEYNLTNDLRTIGMSWPQATANLANSPPHEKLYAMKLLHFTISGDIRKITDAIAIVEFAHSRRMSPIETPIAEEYIEKINTGLISINRKIQSLIKYRIEHDKIPLRVSNNNIPKKKVSFLKRIRNLLRSSRDEIVGLVKNKVPKKEIFKTIAQKKLDELTQKRMSKDVDTMTKWQKVLHVSQRRKRDITSQIKNIKNRMKNIIPKYLRGKINPAIAMKKSRKESVTNKKKTKEHKK